MEELIPIVLFMCVAAVAILRPLTKRLGGLLEMMTLEKQAASRSSADDTDLARIRLLLEHMSKRLDVMEDRLDFTERLVSTTRREALPGTERMERMERMDPLRFEGTSRLSAR